MRVAPAERLAAFRILTGVFAVGYLLVRLPYFIDTTRLDPARWDPPGALAVLDSPPSPGVAQAVLALTIVAGVAYLIGWRYRWTGTAFALLLLAVLTFRNSWSHLFHADNLLVLQVLVVGLAPAADAWSLDARGTPDRPPDVRYGWPLRLAALLTVLTYVVTGVAKLRYGHGWVSGDTLLHQITFDNARKKVLGSTYSPFAGSLAAHPGVDPPVRAAHDPRRAERADRTARPPLGDRLGGRRVAAARRHRRPHGDHVPLPAQPGRLRPVLRLRAPLPRRAALGRRPSATAASPARRVVVLAPPSRTRRRAWWPRGRVR